jgi:phospholipid transport system substrate-binding protein
MKIAKIFIVALGLLFGATSFAADPAPLAMLKSTSNQMLRELDKHIGNLKNNDKLVYDLVDRVLIPHFDLNGMSRAVIGRYWRQSSSATQKQFIKEFTRYVIRTYSSALQSYDGETIKFYPIRGNVGSRVQIDSDLLLKNGPPIQMQYRLRQQGGQWLIYDFSVDGVSIVKNYHSQFAGTLRQGGLDAVVRKLQKNNANRAA